MRDFTREQYRFNVEFLFCVDNYLSNPENASMLQFISPFTKIIKIMPMKEEVVVIFSSIACVKKTTTYCRFWLCDVSEITYIMNADDAQLL